MAKALRNFNLWLDDRQEQSGGFGWFHVWIGAGLLLAMLLLGTSITTYVMVSQRLLVEHVRVYVATQMAAFEQEMRKSPSLSAEEWESAMRRSRERSNRRIAWMQVASADGSLKAQTGSPVLPAAFTQEEIHAHLSQHRPMYKVVDTADGRMLVEVFPFRVRREGGDGHPGYATVEFASPLEGESGALWPLRRNLMINASAALVLLGSLALIALRLRAYVAGRQLEKEVAIARNVQQDLLPSPRQSVERFDLASDFLPAAGVSGDFFDVFTAKGERPAFVLGDVAGKGVPAALLMGVLHGAVRTASWTDSAASHAEATQHLNRLLFEGAATSRYATMFWSYFDANDEHLHYINAGHCPPLLLKAGHRKAILRLSSGGPVLGLLPQVFYQPGSVRVEAGDVLVLFSDGVAEARNASDEQFGEERIVEVVREHSGRGAQAVRDAILLAVEEFSGRAVPEDDRTLCVLVYSGAGKSRAVEPEMELALEAC